MKSISAVIITLNEEENIEDCLKSVKFADEIIVVDTGSTDRTTAIAKQYGSKVFIHPKVTHVEPARNFAIAKAKNEWILLLDADERVSETLAKKLVDLSSEADVYKIPRKNIILGNWMKHTGWWPDYSVRFFKKNAVEWLDEIHSQPKIRGKVESLDSDERWAILHYNYQSVSQYLTKMLQYTSVQARELNRAGRVSWQDFISYPFDEYIRRYFAQEGYKDGMHGLVLSILQAFSEFIVICKAWELQKYSVDTQPGLIDISTLYRKKGHEVGYWLSNSRIKEEKNPLKKATLKVFKKR